ncbi:flagellar hook-associated protein FlgK [Alteraurantiacibacter aquimixticola]|uniref:Flagellar hook-associated protein 1 n=1 Tax=Alteraurantiacibacter aquimixticola TaxID=2489173 RepID=A0A4T3F4W8_9SPHN|nr:flagellar hook-associated protein FlgK [Alteraurantiacibacter aquimixticola]TIX51519.1 flagellar hook-associated protein FlgK [Alteraurantiacibacter aquimixticola]
MSGSLILIGKSGAMAARSALDITAQNIANASNPDYARRTITMEEVAARGGIGMEPAGALSGVRPAQVLRSNSTFLQSEARRTSSDVNRADAELSGLRNAEAAVEQAGIYPAIVDFEASLSRLASDPLDGSLRAAVLEDGRRLAQTFQIATSGLDVAEADITFQTDAGVDQMNLLASELARTNVSIARVRPGSSNMAVLHDQRDALLRDMAELGGITTTYDSVGRVSVQLGGETLVTGAQTTALSKSTNGDGSFAFAVGGNAITLSSGSLLGASQARDAIATLRTDLDALASQVATTANTAQGNGADINGAGGQPFFSGTTAATISLALTSGGQIATAPAGSPAGSRDISNLQALRGAMATNGPARSADTILFTLSSAISARTVTRDALQTIADTAGIALSAETGVDLDQEATNLLRYQQAFEASGRVIQVAADIFDTMLGIGR